MKAFVVAEIVRMWEAAKNPVILVRTSNLVDLEWS